MGVAEVPREERGRLAMSAMGAICLDCPEIALAKFRFEIFPNWKHERI